MKINTLGCFKGVCVGVFMYVCMVRGMSMYVWLLICVCVYLSLWNECMYVCGCTWFVWLCIWAHMYVYYMCMYVYKFVRAYVTVCVSVVCGIVNACKSCKYVCSCDYEYMCERVCENLWKYAWVYTGVWVWGMCPCGHMWTYPEAVANSKILPIKQRGKAFPWPGLAEDKE